MSTSSQGLESEPKPESDFSWQNAWSWQSRQEIYLWREDSRFGISVSLAAGRRVWPYELKSKDPPLRSLRVLVLDPSARSQKGRIAVAKIPFEPLDADVEGDGLDGIEGNHVQAQEANHEDLSCSCSQGQSEMKPTVVGRLFQLFSEEAAQEGQASESQAFFSFNDSTLLLNEGVEPRRTDWRFAMQMTYAICSLVYGSFQHALGRDPSFALKQETRKRGNELPAMSWNLKIYVDDANLGANAIYDYQEVCLRFGYFTSKTSNQQIRKGQRVSTSLSHDIITHELTHALLDGMRSMLTLPTNPQVLGFHEGFADLIAIFQRFEFKELIEDCAEQSGWSFLDHPKLTQIGRELGFSLGENNAIRCAAEPWRLQKALEGTFRAGEWLREEEPEGVEHLLFNPSQEAHDMGEVLMRAVYDAFRASLKRRLSKIAVISGGQQSETSHWLSKELKEIIVEATMKTARQFRAMLIRGIDYLAPVDVTLADYLRAVITADLEMLDIDVLGYRECLVEAFLSRDIWPEDVEGISVEELRWKQFKEFNFSDQDIELEKNKEDYLFHGLDWEAERNLHPHDLSHSKVLSPRSSSLDEGKLAWKKHQLESMKLGQEAIKGLRLFLLEEENKQKFSYQERKNRERIKQSRWELLGLINPRNPQLHDPEISQLKAMPVIIESVRHARRVGTANRLHMDTVIEVSQKVEAHVKGLPMRLIGGLTLILDDRGRLRYAVRQSISKASTWKRNHEFCLTKGAPYWVRDRLGFLEPCRDLVRRIHQSC